jgi:hypothetical protein
MADTEYVPQAENIFRQANGKFFHNNEELSQDEFNKRKSATDEAMRQLRGTRPVARSKADRKKSAFEELDSSMKAGGKVKSASSRADGCAIRGKTRA